MGYSPTWGFPNYNPPPVVGRRQSFYAAGKTDARFIQSG
jgi:hypothetical protein